MNILRINWRAIIHKMLRVDYFQFIGVNEVSKPQGTQEHIGKKCYKISESLKLAINLTYPLVKKADRVFN